MKQWKTSVSKRENISGENEGEAPLTLTCFSMENNPQ